MSIQFATIDALRNSIISPWRGDAAYELRMVHAIPKLETVKDRSAYLREVAKDKIVLDIGCTGEISAGIKKVAKTYYGIDRNPGDGITVLDLDGPETMPVIDEVEIVIASEIIEHLSNPGRFLDGLKVAYPNRPIHITVPNAGAYRVVDGNELVNSEHVCWYSYQTLKCLVTRHGFTIQGAKWYNGEPYRAEGIIMVVSANG